MLVSNGANLAGVAALPGFRKGGLGVSHSLPPDRPISEKAHPGGLIRSTTAGRTDRLPLAVKADSYVIPADILSALGQGNSMAGAKILPKVLGIGSSDGAAAPSMLAGPGMASGGSAPRTSILAAGGEYVINPEDVARIGGGDMKKGHKLLDDFVKRVRAHAIKTMKSLPGPRK